MINVGDNNISVYIGDTELSVYVGEEQIYPMNLGTLTGISLTNIVWVTDVPYSGGTATEENCSYKVLAHYDSGKSRTVTKDATVTGSLVVSTENTGETRTDVGTLELTASYSGFTASGSVEAYQEAYVIDYSKRYFTLRVTSPGNIVWFAESAVTDYKTIQYSKDSGATWASITAAKNSASYISVVSGDVVMFKGTNTGYGNSTTNKSCNFTNTTAGITAEGNIMSMIYGDNFIGNITLSTTYTFRGWFSNIEGMTNAENLVMPATALTSYCYRNFFAGTRLTTGVPKLPATTLAEGCYTNMFINCLSLETAPELPARTLVKQCYDGMLYMQSTTKKLRYIKCLATSMSASNCLRNFHHSSNIASTGTFVKYPGASWANGGTTGIPTGWTIIESTE